MKNLEKFNAETTPLGTELITRDGREVTEWYYFKTYKKDSFRVIAVIDDNKEYFTIEGKYFVGGGDHPYDLFIKPKVKECWANVYKLHNGKVWVGDSFNTKQQAIDNKADGDYIKTIRITDEVE